MNLSNGLVSALNLAHHRYLGTVSKIEKLNFQFKNHKPRFSSTNLTTVYLHLSKDLHSILKICISIIKLGCRSFVPSTFNSFPHHKKSSHYATFSLELCYFRVQCFFLPSSKEYALSMQNVSLGAV